MQPKQVLVTNNNASNIYPYQGTTSKPKIGSHLTVIEDKVPMVYKIKGQSLYFSIVTDGKLSANTLNQIAMKGNQDFYNQTTSQGKTYHLNRWSINNKFVR